MDCTEVMERLADYLDEEVRADLCRAIEEHLHSCRHCTYIVDTVRKTVVLYQADRRVEVPMSAASRLRAALAAEYAASAGSSPGRLD